MDATLAVLDVDEGRAVQFELLHIHRGSGQAKRRAEKLNDYHRSLDTHEHLH
jgi:hypothetical protein